MNFNLSIQTRLSLVSSVQNPGRYADCQRPGRNVLKNDGVCSNDGMFTDTNSSQDACTSSDIYMPLQHRNTRSPAARSDRNMGSKQTIRTNLSIRMNNDTGWMCQQQATLRLAVYRNVRSGNDGPKSMMQHPVSLCDSRDDASSMIPGLILSDRKQQFS